jgi:hypothetical protein
MTTLSLVALVYPSRLHVQQDNGTTTAGVRRAAWESIHQAEPTLAIRVHRVTPAWLLQPMQVRAAIALRDKRRHPSHPMIRQTVALVPLESLSTHSQVC